ncbi:MAG: SCP2 sterol-binding domain-containing protein [Pseudomonadota bacterium]
MTLASIAERLQKGLDKRPLDNSLKFDCGTEGVLTLSGGKAELTDAPTECTIGISLANLEKLIAGKLNPMTAFATGRLKVSGDMAVALKLGKLLA